LEVFGGEEPIHQGDLFHADSVLGRHTAAALDTLFQHLAPGGHRPAYLLRVALVDQQHRMHVAVAGVGHVDDLHVVLLADLDDPLDDLRQSGPRHYAVLGEVIGAQPAQRPGGRLAAFPQQRPLIGTGRVEHFPRAGVAAELDDPLGLPIEPRGGAVEFDNQNRAGVQGESEMERLLDRADDGLVHQFHGRRNDPGRNDPADCSAGVVDGVEDCPHGAEVLWIRRQPDPNPGNDPQGSFAADQHADKVQARRIVDGSQSHDRSIARDDLQSQDVVDGHAVFERVRPAGIGSRISANCAGSLAGRIGGEVKPSAGQGPIQPDVGYARLYNGQPVAEVYLDNAVHSGEHHDNAATHRQTPARQTGSGPTRNHRHAVPVADFDDFGNLVGRTGKNHGIGRALFHRVGVTIVNRYLGRRREHVFAAQLLAEVSGEGGTGHCQLVDSVMEGPRGALTDHTYYSPPQNRGQVSASPICRRSTSLPPGPVSLRRWQSCPPGGRYGPCDSRP